MMVMVMMMRRWCVLIGQTEMARFCVVKLLEKSAIKNARLNLHIGN